MGNCETCTNVDRKSSTNLIPKDETETHDLPHTIYELPDHCPSTVREVYQKLGPFQLLDIKSNQIP